MELLEVVTCNLSLYVLKDFCGVVLDKKKLDLNLLALNTKKERGGVAILIDTNNSSHRRNNAGESKPRPLLRLRTLIYITYTYIHF